MKMKNVMTILLTVVLMCGAANAAIIAATSFEASEGFPGESYTSGFAVTDTSGDYWESGTAGTSYTGIWDNWSHTGSNSALFGNYGNPLPYLLVDPAGADGVGSVDFWIMKSGNTTKPYTDPKIEVQVTTDVLDGSEIWTTLASQRISYNASDPWTPYSVSVNQTGDVKIRIYHAGPWETDPADVRSHVSVDDVTLTAVPEPATMLLLGLGSLMMRRRK